MTVRLFTPSIPFVHLLQKNGVRIIVLYGIGLCRSVSVGDGGHIEAKGAAVIF